MAPSEFWHSNVQRVRNLTVSRFRPHSHNRKSGKFGRWFVGPAPKTNPLTSPTTRSNRLPSERASEDRSPSNQETLAKQTSPHPHPSSVSLSSPRRNQLESDQPLALPSSASPIEPLSIVPATLILNLYVTVEAFRCQLANQHPSSLFSLFI